ncbi:hypothetical protein BCAH820_4390 [Bacillus cereus AH820]|uniref:Uncharacterized protein n=1 Tax=Bacillus cereus (strain AH820) TaxID=405535 RepID=B7JP00_BACC0|nr:hypothetical protein [Bacillus cereus]ACK91346.1 hypothetical protein BCAH820_4390 [Bacillus cereus AH820]
MDKFEFETIEHWKHELKCSLEEIQKDQEGLFDEIEVLKIKIKHANSVASFMESSEEFTKQYILPLNSELEKAEMEYEQLKEKNEIKVEHLGALLAKVNKEITRYKLYNGIA